MGLESNNIKLIAYIVTFVIIVVLIFLLSKFLTGVVKTVGLGIVNRLGGAIFGVCKGLLIASFLFLLFSRIDPQEKLLSPSVKQESYLYKPVSAIAPMVIPVLKKYTVKVKEFIQKDSASE